MCGKLARLGDKPAGYQYPFCDLLAGQGDGINEPEDIVRRTEDAAALIAPRRWPNNLGHVLVVPTGHYENLYAIPTDAYRAVGDLVHEVAVAIRETYGCEGVSTRQHNEPAGHQSAAAQR
ncbi:HIT domain-containing protein [Catellatospora sp. NPDC049133]|uniref:HIT family protein n=1 Tax=Catellatospora sp. NPDC049133 TaxID=3155499 RepID=UPI0033CBE5D3